jgi:hypothetical protein
MQYATINPPHGLKLLWLLTLLMAFFYNLHGVPLFDIDEGAFSQATREMALRNDYLTLYLNGEPRHDKPILTYWLQALSVAAFGVHEFAFRLPSAIAATLWNLLIVLFTWRLTTPRTALIAGTLMAGALGSGIIGKAATADALLNLFLSGTLFSLYLNLVTAQKRYIIAAALFAGLGFLTKGPIALLIPAMSTLLYSLWSGKWRQWLKILLSPTAWLVFLSVGLPWYIINYLKAGPEFIEGFIGVHNIGRFTQSMESHSGPWWYYLPAMLLMAFPFGIILLQPFSRLKSLVQSPFNRFLISWFVFVLVFFSFSATKLPHYILYGLPPLFILGALQLSDQVDLKPVYIPLIAFVLLLLGLPHLLAQFLPQIDNTALSEVLRNPERYLPGNYHLMLLLTLFCTVWLLFDRRWPSQGRLLSAGIISTFIASELLLPIVGRLQQEPIREAGLIAAQQQASTVMWRINNPSFSVYSGQITPKRKPTEGELVLTKSRHLKKLPRHQILYERQGIVLARIEEEEQQDVAQQSQTMEQNQPMDTPSDHGEQRASNRMDSTEQSTFSVVEQPQSSPVHPGTMGDTHHTRRRTGRHRAVAATLQTPPQGRSLNVDIGPSGRTDGSSLQGRDQPSETRSGVRQGDDHHPRPDSQTGQFPFRPYRNPVRPVGKPNTLAETGVATGSAAYADAHRYPRRPFANHRWRPLAHRYPYWRGHRMGLFHSRQSTHAASIDNPTSCQLGWPIANPMRHLPAPFSPYWLSQRATHTTRYRLDCPGSDLPTTPEGASHTDTTQSSHRELIN